MLLYDIEILSVTLVWEDKITQVNLILNTNLLKKYKNPDPLHLFRSAAPSTIRAGPADQVIYLGYSFYDLNNPDFHHGKYYAFEDVIGKNALRYTEGNIQIIGTRQRIQQGIRYLFVSKLVGQRPDSPFPIAGQSY